MDEWTITYIQDSPDAYLKEALAYAKPGDKIKLDKKGTTRNPNEAGE